MRKRRGAFGSEYDLSLFFFVHGERCKCCRIPDDTVEKPVASSGVHGRWQPGPPLSDNKRALRVDLIQFDVYAEVICSATAVAFATGLEQVFGEEDDESGTLVYAEKPDHAVHAAGYEGLVT